jgi:hypothetical protein
MWHESGTAASDGLPYLAAIDASSVRPASQGDTVLKSLRGWVARSPASSGSAVHITTMTDRYDSDGQDLILDDVEDAVATDPNAVLIPSAC